MYRRSAGDERATETQEAAICRLYAGGGSSSERLASSALILMKCNGKANEGAGGGPTTILVADPVSRNRRVLAAPSLRLDRDDVRSFPRDLTKITH